MRASSRRHAPRALTVVLVASVVVLGGAVGAEAGDAAAAVIRRLVASTTDPYLTGGAFAEERADVERLYQPRDFAPLWLRGGRPTPQADEVIATLADADAHGLTAADYDGDRLGAALARLGAARHPSSEDAGLLDVALTVATMRYATDAYAGRIPPQRVGFELDAVPKRLDLPAVVGALARSDDPARRLAALDPPVPTFARLRQALAEMRALAARTDLPDVPADLPALHPGDRHPGIPALRSRLVALGDLLETTPAPVEPTVYDRDVAAAVRRFQQRHGLDPDGIVGPVTRGDLRVPLRERVAQVQLAMERLRWFPDDIAGRWVVVNIPEFRLWGFEGSDPIPRVSMKVVVGSAARRTETPIVHAHMRYVVFRPYWDVPASIARKEILPRAARDRGYLAREHMAVVDGRVRQRPGPDNALGLVKFVFPNPFDVYLHDTPQKEYFARSRRDFSHGCMRVAEAAALAEFVLGWDRERIEAAMTTGPDDRRVSLLEEVAVYVVYTTAAVEDRRIFFFDDIYGHDATLARALANRYAYRASR